MLSIAGKPYDTLEEVIGITGNKGDGSLADFGVEYKQIDLTSEGFDFGAIENALKEHALYDRFDFVRSEARLFEILPKGVHKGLALGKLAEHLGIDMNRTVAIGDYDNDAAMLKAAGCGIAVSNASKSALEAADMVTVSNEEHAIARVIYDIRDQKIKLGK